MVKEKNSYYTCEREPNIKFIINKNQAEIVQVDEDDNYEPCLFIPNYVYHGKKRIPVTKISTGAVKHQNYTSDVYIGSNCQEVEKNMCIDCPELETIEFGYLGHDSEITKIGTPLVFCCRNFKSVKIRYTTNENRTEKYFIPAIRFK